jgi:3-oxoacyl-[acyl-carrier protein] reductase
MNEHQDLRVIVTGAASGIGRAAAEALQNAGARVIGLDVMRVAASVPLVHVDLTQESEVVAAVSEAVSMLGGLDALVNAAGIGRSSRLASFDLAAFDLMMSVNVRGSILAARDALRYFGDGGKIVNIASELAYLGRAGASGYCATKGAILALTRSWARELAPAIHVNAIAPGPIDTPLLDFASLSPEKQALETSNPLGRIGHPKDVADAVLFLLSRKTSFITGQCISVDGGAAMH